MTLNTAAAGKLSHWFTGLFLLVVAILGLAFASHATGGELHYTLGLTVAGAGILGLFLLIKRTFDQH